MCTQHFWVHENHPYDNQHGFTHRASNFASEQLSGGHPVRCSGCLVFLTNHFLTFFFRPFLRGVDCEAVPLEVPVPVTGGMKVELSSDSPVPISAGGKEPRDSEIATGAGTEEVDAEG